MFATASGTSTSFLRTAAFNADAHGVHLAGQADQLAPNLREVQFIAHSAGSWAARAAAQRLLQLNPYVVVQVTLLDPFVSDPSGVLYGGDFSDSAMSGMQSFSGNDRIQLENYYADDSPVHGWNAYPWGDWTGPTYDTQETFNWRGGIDINQEVDWGAVLLNPPGPNSLTYNANYDWHSGPITFYSDCVSANLFPGTIPSGLQGAGCPFDYQQIGWMRSLYSLESVLPQITAQPANRSGLVGGTVTFTVTANRTTAYQWYKVGGGSVGTGLASAEQSVFRGRRVLRCSRQQCEWPTLQPACDVDGWCGHAGSQFRFSFRTYRRAHAADEFIKVFGSGFSSSSTLTFNDGVDPPYTGGSRRSSVPTSLITTSLWGRIRPIGRCR